MKEVIATGKTIEDAKQKGADELNVSADDVIIEVLDAPSSGFLGIGAKPARLLVKYVDPNEEIKKETKPAKTFSSQKNYDEKKNTTQPSFVSEQKVEHKEKSYKPAEEPQEPFVPTPNAEEFVQNYLVGLFEQMHFNVEISIKREGRFIYVDLKGEEVGALIGKHGDTLDSIQHLTQLAFNKGLKGGEKIRIDTEGYREKREKILVSLAKSIANKVIKSRGKYELEPMKAYERKIMHATLQSYPMLTTYSVGVEPQRRLIIAFKHRNQNENR